MCRLRGFKPKAVRKDIVKSTPNSWLCRKTQREKGLDSKTVTEVLCELDMINGSAELQTAGRIQWHIRGRAVVFAGPEHRSAIGNSPNTIALERLQDLLA